jgi:hypothetical protein
MAVTKSAYYAIQGTDTWKLDCAPFPRSESKRVADLLVNGVAVPSAVSRSKSEVYYTYFMWEGKSYSFPRGWLVTVEDGEEGITLEPVVGARVKAAPAPKVEESVDGDAPIPADIEAANAEGAAILAEVPEAPKPKKTRKPKTA